MDMNKGEPTFDAKAQEQLKNDVMSAVDECIASGAASKEECIDAIIAKLKGMEADGGPAMGGLGTAEDQKMDLGPAEGGE